MGANILCYISSSVIFLVRIEALRLRPSIWLLPKISVKHCYCLKKIISVKLKIQQHNVAKVKIGSVLCKTSSLLHSTDRIPLEAEVADPQLSSIIHLTKWVQDGSACVSSTQDWIILYWW